MFKHILIAFDGSEYARKALTVAIDLAKIQKAELSLISVEEHLPSIPADVGEVREEKELENGLFKKLQREAKKTAQNSGVTIKRANILVGHVSKSILDYAKAVNCDLIVMGHSGRSGAWTSFLGTTADKVSHHAHCSVLIVR